jgi:hypothetical protein
MNKFKVGASNTWREAPSFELLLKAGFVGRNAKHRYLQVIDAALWIGCVLRKRARKKGFKVCCPKPNLQRTTRRQIDRIWKNEPVIVTARSHENQNVIPAGLAMGNHRETKGIQNKDTSSFGSSALAPLGTGDFAVIFYCSVIYWNTGTNDIV